MLSQWREIVQAFAGRQARFGTLAAASILVVLGILIAINYLSTRHNKRWDLTAAHQFSLSDQTKKVLADLKEPVKISVFARSDEFQRFRDRLDEYTYQSKQLSVEYIDPEKRPGLAQQLGVTALGTIVLEYKGRNEKVNSEAEQELTNGLIKVIQGRQPKVYFTQGHGEKDTAGAQPAGYSGDRGGPHLGELRRRQGRPRAAGRGAGRRGRAGHRGPEDRFSRAGDRRREGVPRQGREAARDAGSGPQGRPAAAGRAAGPAEGLGHRRRQRRHPRRQRDGPAARHRRIGAGRGELSAASDHRRLQAADGVPAGAVDVAGRRRRQRPHGAEASSRPAAGAGPKRTSRASTAGQPAKQDEGDKAGPVALAAAVSAPADRDAAAGDARRRKATRRSRPRRASSPSAIPTSRATARSASAATAISS